VSSCGLFVAPISSCGTLCRSASCPRGGTHPSEKLWHRIVRPGARRRAVASAPRLPVLLLLLLETHIRTILAELFAHMPLDYRDKPEVLRRHFNGGLASVIPAERFFKVRRRLRPKGSGGALRCTKTLLGKLIAPSRNPANKLERGQSHRSAFAPFVMTFCKGIVEYFQAQFSRALNKGF
jgi:hypothetical protein